MLPSCVKTEIWRQLAESLVIKLNVAVVCEQAIFGKLSFFQELRNRMSDSPYSSVPGVKYVSVQVDDVVVNVGPFRTDEIHALDEELADARQKLPTWKDSYNDLIHLAIDQATIAGRSEHILREGLQKSNLLLEFSQSVAHVKTVEQALFTSVQFLSHKFKLNNIFFYSHGKKARQFDLSEAGKAAEQRVIAELKNTKSACAIKNVETDFLLEGIKELDTLPKCITGFPLISNRELIGYSVLYSEQLPPLDDVSEVLYELVAVLSRLSSFEKIHQSATTDALTGLSNRTELVPKFDGLVKDLATKECPISVLMIDVDNFKNFNDTKGHPEGDRVLRSVADIMKAVAPKGSICCRYGGEEFIMVLPNFVQLDAKDIAEAFRKTVEENCELTISIGIITCMNSSVSREVLVKESDRALYRAKHLGKNKVVAFLIVDKSLGIIDV